MQVLSPHLQLQLQQHLEQLLSPEQQQAILVALALLGSLHLLSALLNLLYYIWAIFLRPGKDLRKVYGRWAVVTGATDGIGKGFAEEFARMRMNLVLVSRSLDKLQALAKDLEAKHKIDVRLVAADFSRPGSAELNEAYGQVARIASTCEVGVLVNNVGVSYPYAKYLHELDDELISNIIAVNVQAATRLTKIVLPGMLERRRGAIVNIGSGAATVIPSDPLYTVYAATKAYMDQFSKTLSVEYAGQGIDVQCQAPLYVATKLAKIRRATLTCPSPAGYARSAVRWIGYDARCTPFWAHAVMWAVISRLPTSLLDYVRKAQNVSIRRRGMAKEAGKKE